MEWEEVHGYTGDEMLERPNGLSRSAWKRDRRIVLNLLNEPHAFDLVKPPEIREPFDGNDERLVGRTLWGNGFGTPQFDEDGKLIDRDALVEQWKVDYYEFRRHSRQQVEKRHGGYYIDENGRHVSTDPRVRSYGKGYDNQEFFKVKIPWMLLAVVFVGVALGVGFMLRRRT